MPRVCAPSESRTIAPGTLPSLPLGTPFRAVFATWTASARPSPIAVPASGTSRSIPSCRIVRSVVGTTSSSGLLENETSPILTPFGTLSEKIPIACCAAPSRDGFTSLARIEPETSTSRTIVALSDGTETFAVGRATAAEAEARASRKRTSGSHRQSGLRRFGATEASTSRFVNATA